MSEQYKELLESELLNDDTKKQLQEAFEQKLNEQREEIRNEVESEYAEKFVENKQQLANQLYQTIQESVEQEIAELKEDLEYYKSLDVHYARKLTEFKESYKKEMAAKWKEFLENQVQSGFAELKEDLDRAKENEFGRQVFEAFREQFQIFESQKEGGSSLKEELDNTKTELQKIKEENENLKRDQLLESLLSNLSGVKRETMATMLEGVSYDRLESKYEEVLPLIMKETEEDKGEQDTLNESGESRQESSDLSRFYRFAGITKTSK